jgi:hypothetical protein
MPGGPISKRINGSGTNKNLVIGSDEARNQEKLCCRGPAEIYYCSRLCYAKMYMNIIFQYPVALVNDLICRGSLEFATSCRARKLLVGPLLYHFFIMLLL